MLPDANSSRPHLHRLAAGTLLVLVAASTASAATRSRKGLQALYDFSSPAGPVVKDRSGVGKPVDLHIADPKAVTRSKGSLEIRGKTLVASKNGAGKIAEAVRRSGEITIEAWIRPAGKDQEGPARIVTLSRNSTERNFTLGQEKDRFEVRLRTTSTSKNGIPALRSSGKKLQPRLTHVVYTRDRSGKTRLFLDGLPSGEAKVAGTPSNWAKSYQFALANELNGSRPWKGTYHLVAVYDRDLTPAEVKEHFRAGIGAPTEQAAPPPDPGNRLFETRVAPLIAEHCLECHDAANRKGDLDLSRKKPAFAGGEEGPAIVPGHADKSLLWESIASDEMPKKRDPLSAEDKRLLKDWIDSGAPWSIDFIDPVVYARGDDGKRGTWVQRLTVDEYIATVRGAVGVDITSEAREILPRDLRADGFANTAYNLTVDFAHVEAYARLAEIIVSRMDVGAFAKQFSKSRSLIDKDNRALIEKMGLWVFRGPLEPREINAFRGIATTVMSSGGNFEEATAYILEAMLQSARFLYRIENQQGDGDPVPASEYELASRMSYIIWGGPPDRELMDAAEARELSDPAIVELQLTRMLDDPRARSRATAFASDWLNLGRLENLNPNAEKFPAWNKQLARDMREETLAFFEEIVWEQERPLSDLLNAQVTFLSPALAKHYGLAPQDKSRDRYDLSAIPERGGLLTQGSLLTMGGDEASMVTRGLFVMQDLLRGIVKNPPPDLNVAPVPSSPGQSHRTIAEQRVASETCGGCHSKFEPLAYGLEKFDGLGSFHDRDEFGNHLREDGEILFPGQPEPVTYSTSAELMTFLARSDRVRQTLTWKLAQFALGRPLGASDARSLEQIHEKAQNAGGTYASLITAIVMSDLVQNIRTEAAKQP